MTTPAVTFSGSCPECGAFKTFDTERARDLWLKHHAHDWNDE
jgi:hypothetical protein